MRRPRLEPHHIRAARHYLRQAVIHSAMTLFAADLLASIWPVFERVWDGVAHQAVALAAFLAIIPEYIHEEEELHHDHEE